MFNIVCHYGNANINNIELSLHTYENGNNQEGETATTPSSREDAEQGELTFAAGGEARGLDTVGDSVVVS